MLNEEKISEPILEETDEISTEEELSEEKTTEETTAEEKTAEEIPAEESEKLIEYKTKAFISALNDLYKCETYYHVKYDNSSCMPYVKYDKRCEIPKPLDTSLNNLYLDKFNQMPYDIIREKRTELLKECDWTILSDVSLNNIEDWKTYRQALRDVPNVNPDATFDIAGNVINVSYPVKPN